MSVGGRGGGGREGWCRRVCVCVCVCVCVTMDTRGERWEVQYSLLCLIRTIRFLSEIPHTGTVNRWPRATWYF